MSRPMVKAITRISIAGLPVTELARLSNSCRKRDMIKVARAVIVRGPAAADDEPAFDRDFPVGRGGRATLLGAIQEVQLFPLR